MPASTPITPNIPPIILLRAAAKNTMGGAKISRAAAPRNISFSNFPAFSINIPKPASPATAPIIAPAMAAVPAIRAATLAVTTPIVAASSPVIPNINCDIFTIAAPKRTRAGPTNRIALAPSNINSLMSFGFFSKSLSDKSLNASRASLAATVNAPAAATIAATVPAVSATVVISRPNAPTIICAIFTIVAPNNTKAGPSINKAPTIERISPLNNSLIFGNFTVSWLPLSN